MAEPTAVIIDEPLDIPETYPQTVPDYILEASQLAAVVERQTGRGSYSRKFGSNTIVKLLTAIRNGMYYEPACRVAGCSYESFHRWMDRADDDEPDGPYATFASAVKVAEAEAEAESLHNVRVAAKDPRFWAAGMTFLERRHPDRWSKRPEASVSVQVGIAVGMPGQGLHAPVRQIVNENAMSPPLSIEAVAAQPALSPKAARRKSLSPRPPKAVSEANRKAKATPTHRVSPRSVA